MPSQSAGWFARNLPPLGSSLQTRLQLASNPVELKLPVYFSIQKVLDDNRRFFELASMHYLCHGLKHAGWLSADYRDAIRDKYDAFWDMLTCGDNELGDRRGRYGADLPAAREADTLRSQYTNAKVRCYDIAYLWLAKDKWGDLQSKDPGHLYNLVKSCLTSEDYQNHWLPRTINISDRVGSPTVEQRLGMLGDKLRILQRAGGVDNAADIRAVVDQLAKVAALTGIARRSLIDSPHPVRHRHPCSPAPPRLNMGFSLWLVPHVLTQAARAMRLGHHDHVLARRYRGASEQPRVPE